jgi:outer membrane biogenesis lipoprotein LolB
MRYPTRVFLGLIAATALLSACASKPDIVPAGKDHGKNLYAISGQADLNASASRQANQYCQRHGKAAVIQDAGYKDSGFTFSCSDD